ncbi:hypothetical protein KIPB_005114, partial [Kipferlia bialata]|eukprot:g5114.t1
MSVAIFVALLALGTVLIGAAVFLWEKSVHGVPESAPKAVHAPSTPQVASVQPAAQDESVTEDILEEDVDDAAPPMECEASPEEDVCVAERDVVPDVVADTLVAAELVVEPTVASAPEESELETLAPETLVRKASEAPIEGVAEESSEEGEAEVESESTETQAETVAKMLQMLEEGREKVKALRAVPVQERQREPVPIVEEEQEEDAGVPPLDAETVAEEVTEAPAEPSLPEPVADVVDVVDVVEPTAEAAVAEAEEETAVPVVIPVPEPVPEAEVEPEVEEAPLSMEDTPWRIEERERREREAEADVPEAVTAVLEPELQTEPVLEDVPVETESLHEALPEYATEPEPEAEPIPLYQTEPETQSLPAMPQEEVPEPEPYPETDAISELLGSRYTPESLAAMLEGPKAEEAQEEVQEAEAEREAGAPLSMQDLTPVVRHRESLLPPEPAMSPEEVTRAMRSSSSRALDMEENTPALSHSGSRVVAGRVVMDSKRRYEGTVLHPRTEPVSEHDVKQGYDALSRFLTLVPSIQCYMGVIIFSLVDTIVSNTHLCREFPRLLRSLLGVPGLVEYIETTVETWVSEYTQRILAEEKFTTPTQREVYLRATPQVLVIAAQELYGTSLSPILEDALSTCKAAKPWIYFGSACVGVINSTFTPRTQIFQTPISIVSGSGVDGTLHPLALTSNLAAPPPIDIYMHLGGGCKGGVLGGEGEGECVTYVRMLRAICRMASWIDTTEEVSVRVQTASLQAYLTIPARTNPSWTWVSDTDTSVCRDRGVLDLTYVPLTPANLRVILPVLHHAP